MTSQDWTCRSPMLMIDSIWSFFLITAVTSLRLFPSLFPYTTLFRSACVQRLETEPEDIGSQQRYGHCRPRRLESKPQVTDRKSTRLNSSHVAISYAVFCLKNKSISTRNQEDDAAPTRCMLSANRCGS